MASRSTLPNSAIHEIAASKELTYIVDTRTRLCFVSFASTVYGGGAGGLTRVDCAPLLALPEAAKRLTWLSGPPPAPAPPPKPGPECAAWRAELMQASSNSEKLQIAKRKPKDCP